MHQWKRIWYCISYFSVASIKYYDQKLLREEREKIFWLTIWQGMQHVVKAGNWDLHLKHKEEVEKTSKEWNKAIIP